MLPLMRQSGSLGERGGVCIGHQNRAAKKNPSGFSEYPQSFNGLENQFGFSCFFYFSSARSSCFHKSEIFIIPILLQDNSSSPELFFPVAGILLLKT